MQPTIIFRHKKENLKKCSLRGLESRDDFIFYTWPNSSDFKIKNYIYLTIDAPPLTKEDSAFGLLAIDATWALADLMTRRLEPLLAPLIPRSIPNHYRTAYPRRQTLCSDPERGLATIEALYIAYTILGKETTGLLDNYYWKEEFLQINQFPCKELLV